MSTKVYDGYIFKGFKSPMLNDFLRKFNEIKEQIIHEQKMEILKTFYMEYIIPDNLNTLDELNINSFLVSQDLYKSLSFVIFQKHKSKTFCMIFGDSKSTEIIKESFSLNEYMYYNNSDRPDNISKRLWKKRDDNWASILGGNYSLSPNEAGVNFGIKTSIFDITQDDFIFFQNNTDLDSIKKSIFRNNFHNNHPNNTNHSQVVKDYRKLSKEELLSGTNNIELKFDFTFPNQNIKTNDINIPSYQEISSDKQFSLDDFCKDFNKCYARRLLKLNSIFKGRFQGQTIDDYFDSDRDKTTEIIKLINSSKRLFLAINVLKMNRSTIIFNEPVNIYKDINIDREIINYFWDKS